MKAQRKKVTEDHKATDAANEFARDFVNEFANSFDKPGVEDHIEALIDEAVEESFPCSDPPSYSCAKAAVANSSQRNASANKRAG